MSDAMLTEEDSEAFSSWEGRAEQLFRLCDKECKGFITKRDLQRLWGELPLGPDELEGVFDSLDQDHNGFLTLQEFTDGFGNHLGLEVEFRADYDIPKEEEEEEDDDRERKEKGNDLKDLSGRPELGSITSEQIDEILQCFAKQDFNISPSVVESVVQDVCHNDAASEEPSLGCLVTALLQELSRAKTEQAQLEAALSSKTEQYNQQVAHLYEELESQISGERNKVKAEHNQRGARALASLEQEVKDRENAFRVLQEDNAALLKKVENLTSLVTAGKQDNVRLTQHLSKLEEEYSLKEREAEELSVTLEHMRKNIKDEKRRRAQQALKVSEGIALERESLVTQLGLLRIINTELRDEHDQSEASTPSELSRSRYPHQEQLTASAPITSKKNSVTFESVAGITTEIAVPQKALPVPIYGGVDRTSPDDVNTPSDFEHDESYFENSSVSTSESPLFATLMTPSPDEQQSLLQELLLHPCRCSADEGNQFDSPDKDNTTDQRMTFQRTDSITQTSPTLLSMKRLQTEDFLSPERKDPIPLEASPDTSIHPDTILPARENYPSGDRNDQDYYGDSWNQFTMDNEEPTVEESEQFQKDKLKSRFKNPKVSDVTKVCDCHRESHPPSSPICHSSTLIYHPELSMPQLDLPLDTYTNQAFIYPQRTYHSHTYLPIVHTNTQSTTTTSEDFQKEEFDQDFQERHLEVEFENVKYVDNESQNEEIKSLYIINCRCALIEEKEISHSEIQAEEEEEEEDEDKVAKNTSSDEVDQSDTGSHIAKMNSKNHKKLETSGSSRIGEIDTGDVEGSKEDFEERETTGGRVIPLSAVTTTRIFKVVFIGDSAVGKTTFIHRAAVGEFRNFATTVGVDYRLMHTCVGGVNALLQLWDTAGQERYRAITRQYYRKADCVVVMYDITCERSFLHVTDWITSVREFGDPNLVLAIIGNKKDLQKSRRVNIENAYTLAKANEALLYEVSASKGQGVTEVMKHIAGILTTDQQHNIDTSATVTLHKSSRANPRLNGKCCQ
ncbi:EF-hand calcium-binding domain-containing protein 4B-like isoform X2 [Palaemon carinicauda]|uniref:EF-hand calcium-binding domain-containing protein 4B-like isoform X2 n=1 Tax=Palaemon carinicauda TaxID=392227 RepID=UPI0035B59147